MYRSISSPTDSRPLGATAIAYLGLTSYQWIGIAWLLHAAWDLAHHVWGNPIWPFAPTSSFGCMIFDAVIAVWFLAGASSIVRAGSSRH